MIVDLIEALYRLLWGDLFTLPVAGGIGISFMVVLLFAAGIGFTLRTRLLPVRLFRDMIGAVCEKKQTAGGLSSFQTLVISTATRVGMGNLVGVVAAVSAGGAGAVFWMWVTALLGASTSFVESTLAQKYRVPDPLYGGWRGGPAYYLHVLAERKRGKKLKRSVCAALFAVSGLICWCGISQVISNSVSSAFENAFHVPPLATTVVLTLLAALIVLRKNATVKSLDFIVPVMAVCYFVITVGIVVLNLRQLPAVLARIFAEAFGLRQVAAGGFGAVLMNGVKRGLFSNEAGSGSAPCAAAAAECDDPVKMGLVQALGVLIDTVVICSCTAFLMLLVPQDITAGLTGMDLLQTAMQYHLGSFGIVFIAVILALFSFSTFLGVLYYARGNVAYLCGDNWWSQTAYKLLALAMLLVGGTQAYTVVWDLGDVGIGLMTIFNMLVIFPLSKQAIDRWGWYNRNAAINPYLSEGKKTVSLEIAEQLGWKMPDYLAISVGDGCTIAGVWKGLKDLYAIGFIDKLPRLISAQAEGCHPINRAIAENKPWEPMEENTLADSIAVGVPRNADKALMAIRESNGIVVNVTDEEIMAAQKLLGRTCGVFGEPAGVTGTAGVKKLCEQGVLGANDTVVKSEAKRS